MVEIQSVDTKYSSPMYKCGENMVSLAVYPRIHMFNLDLSLMSGVMKHGSMGISLKDMPIFISVKKISGEKDLIESDINLSNLDYILRLDHLRKCISSNDHWDIKVKNPHNIREHTGLGLSSQIASGILLCCAKTLDINMTIDDIFRQGIGHYSTLGINLSFNPGVIIEMGVKPTDKSQGLIINPVLSQKYEKPVNYLLNIKHFPFYLIIGIPIQLVSISGEEEKKFWQSDSAMKAIPYQDKTSLKVTYMVFEEILPSIVEGDFTAFILAMNKIAKLGAKPVEESIQHFTTKKVLTKLRDKFDFAATSSLGPTVFAFSEDNPRSTLESLNNKDYKFYIYDFQDKT